MSSQQPQVTILLDFDGTITENDLLDQIAQTFGDPDVYREVDEKLDEGGITLHEVLQREFAPVRADLDEVVAWVLEHAAVRPGFGKLVERARERSWRLVVLSSGFRELIEPVLAREGLAGVELHSNQVEADPEGWRVRFRDESTCSICGEPCKRAAVLRETGDGLLAYVGDGFSDRCGAQATDLVFARRGLAAYLAQERVPYEPFDDFYDVLRGIERRLARGVS